MKTKQAKDNKDMSSNVGNYLAAAHNGKMVAMEMQLFMMYDDDNSGTLTKSELRHALAMVRTVAVRQSIAEGKHGKVGALRTASHGLAIDSHRGDIPGMNEMLAELDGDGDGEVTMEEWLHSMPESLKAGLRRLDPDVLKMQMTSAAKTGSDHANMRKADLRGQELARFKEKQRINRKAQRHDSIVGGHVRAAHDSRVLDTVSIFREFDHDGSGSLTVRELRHALSALLQDLPAGMTVCRGHASLLANLDAGHSKPSRSVGRPLIYSPTKCQVKDLLGAFDGDGDGEVDLSEFEKQMPAVVRDMLLRRQQLAQLGNATVRHGDGLAKAPGRSALRGPAVKQNFGSSGRFYAARSYGSGSDPSTRVAVPDSVGRPWFQRGGGRAAGWQGVLDDERQVLDALCP
jgi:Ca2+-binding EF-hand superfamily protein